MAAVFLLYYTWYIDWQILYTRISYRLPSFGLGRVGWLRRIMWHRYFDQNPGGHAARSQRRGKMSCPPGVDNIQLTFTACQVPVLSLFTNHKHRAEALYSPPHLQWHQLQWHSIPATILFSKKNNLMLRIIRIKWQPAYAEFWPFPRVSL